MPRKSNGEEENLFSKWCWSNSINTFKQNKTKLLPDAKINPKWIKLNVKTEITKIKWKTGDNPNILGFAKTS